MNNLPYYLGMALFAGAIIPIQTVINSGLVRSIGNPFQATFVIYLSATLLMGAVVVAQRQPLPSLTQLSSIPTINWIGGLIGTTYTLLLLFLAPKLGIATVTGFVVAGQILIAVGVDHFGLLSFPVHLLNWQRLTGALLMIAGLYLIKKY